MQVDIKVPSLPNDRRVWRLFPGESYSFLDQFKDQRVGFLDFPGIQIPAKWAQVRDLLSTVKRSLALKEIIAKQGVDTLVDVSALDISKYRSSEKRKRDTNAIKSLYYEAKKGDVVVLPEPKSLSRIWVGEIQDDVITLASSPKKYGNYLIPARNISWIKSINESAVSYPLSSSLRRPHPFTILESSLFNEVFSIIYDSYVFQGRFASSIFNSHDFLDIDASLLANISKIAAASCRILDMVDYEVHEEEGSISSIVEILIGNPPYEYTCNQSSDIHSEGFLRYVSGTNVPLVIASLFTSLVLLSGCSNKEELSRKLNQIEYVNSSTLSDPECTARVSQASKVAPSMMGIDTTWTLCHAAREAAKRNLKSSARPKT